MSFTKSQVNEILDKLEEQYPDADCALEHGSVFQLLVAVVLSAQTTDKSVNVVTKDLFEKYPDAHLLRLDSDTFYIYHVAAVMVDNLRRLLLGINLSDKAIMDFDFPGVGFPV